MTYKKSMIMKRIFITLFLATLFLPGLVIAQGIDRSQAPAPDPAPVIELGKTEEFTLKNGLNVILVENHRMPRVSFSLILDRPPLTEGDKVGLLEMTGQLLRRGTSNRSKEQIDEEIDFIGASLRTTSSRIAGSSLTRHKEKVLTLMQDILFNATFPADELEKIREEALSGLKASKSDPDFAMGNVRGVALYGADHPYGEVQTEEDINNITREDCKDYFDTWFKPNHSYLVIVGDITLKEAKKLTKTYFKAWEPGEVPSPTYETPQRPEETTVAFVDRPEAVQSIINVTYPVELTPGHPDFIKASVMNGILGGGVFAGRLMRQLRETHAWTYGAFSRLRSDELIGNFSASASVRNEVTDSAIAVMMEEIERLRTERVEAGDLQLMKNFMNGNFALSLEDPATVAAYALNTRRYNLPADYYASYLEKLSAVTPEDVLEMAQKYLHPDQSWIVVVGKGADVAHKMKQFGPVQYYDIFGEPTTFNAAPPVPEGMTADRVLQTYIDAIGGAENLNAINTLKVVRKAETPRGNMIMTIINKAPHQSLMQLTVEGMDMEIQARIYDGKQYQVRQMGAAKPYSESEEVETRSRAYIAEELYYEENGVSTTLKGTEMVEDKAAYVIDVAFPGGRTFTNYYDMESGLKLQTAITSETERGPVTSITRYSGYEQQGEILVPATLSIITGGNNLSFDLVEAEVNQPVDEAAFSIK